MAHPRGVGELPTIPPREESSPEDGVFPAGTVVDRRYRIDGVLGSGGLGVVYRAEHLVLKRAVALKVLYPEVAERGEFRKRFEREAAVLSALEHENIVTVYDFGVSDGTPYLAMELLQGESLASLLEREGALSPPLCFDIMHQVLSGLAFAHKKGILHRDLKPGNLIVSRDGADAVGVKILDFGFAKILDGQDGVSEPALTTDGAIFGTPAYMSPEQAAGASTDARSDVYSAGVVLYELLCGRPPFLSDNQMAMIRAHIAEPPPDPAKMRDGLVLSADLQDLLDTALAKTREARFSDAEAMFRAFRGLPREGLAWVGSQPPKARLGPLRAVSSKILLAPRGRRSWKGLFWGAGGLAALALLGAGVWGALPSASAPATAEGRTQAPSSTKSAQPSPAVVTKSKAREPEPAAGSIKPAASDPFRRRTSRTLRGLYRKATQGADPLTQEEMRTLRQLQRQYPEDVRPSLILARDFASRGWFKDALTRYQIVFDKDPSARGNSWMKRDLVRVAATRLHGDRAGGMVREIYGPEAAAEVRRLLADSSLSPDERARLSQLQADIEKPID